MLVKLIKFHSTDLSDYANETFEDILIHICDGISDWEEIDKNQFWTIERFIDDYNSANKNKERYLLVQKPQTTLKFCIDEQLKKEQEKIKKRKEDKEEYKKKRELEKTKQLKKKEEREKKKLEELKKKYGEQ